VTLVPALVTLVLAITAEKQTTGIADVIERKGTVGKQ